MTTLGFLVWSKLAQYQTIEAVSADIGEKRQVIDDALNRLAKLGFAERAQKAHGPGYPALWKQTGKEMPERMMNSPAQLANLRKGPKVRADKYRGVRRPEVGLKISAARRMQESRKHFQTLKLPEPKCLLAALWKRV
jgi:hypothetical protein